MMAQHKTKDSPGCIAGHTNGIIPIIYGEPTIETMEKAARGEIKLGGCLLTDNDPAFYCTIHDLEIFER